MAPTATGKRPYSPRATRASREKTRPASASGTAVSLTTRLPPCGPEDGLRSLLERGGLDAEDPRDPRGQPPVPAAEELHRTWQQEGAHNRHVDEDGSREAESELLQLDERADDEAHEGGDHDQARGGDEPARLGQSVRDRLGVVLGRVPLLAHAGDEEDLVGHGEA